MQTLIDRGADIDDPRAAGNGHTTVKGCLANGRPTSAEYLAAHGARLDLETAAGVGRLDAVRSFFNADGTLKPAATPAQLQAGFIWACTYGRLDVAEFLLDRGASVDPALAPARESPLHSAAYGGIAAVVELLLARGAPVNVKDETHHGTPLDWALYGWTHLPYWTKPEGYYRAVALLIRAGASIDPGWLDADVEHPPLMDKIRNDPRMAAALRGTVDR